MTNHLSEMWGDNAVHALCGLVATRAEPVDGKPRTMIGGVVLDGFGTDQWERWRGTIILIPKMIDVTREPCWWQVQDLMKDGINRDVTPRAMSRSDSFWKPKWRDDE